MIIGIIITVVLVALFGWFIAKWYEFDSTNESCLVGKSPNPYDILMMADLLAIFILWMVVAAIKGW